MRRVVVVLLLPMVAACSTVSSGATASGTGASAPAATSAAVPSVAATVPAGYPAEAFRVAAPVLLIPAGPGPAMQQTPCRGADVTASAATMRVADGVAGVIHLKGKACSLHITTGPTALLAANGDKLPVELAPPPVRVDPIGDPRPDIPLASGDVLWGFAWRGSWCGAAPASVLVPMGDDPATSGGTASYGDLKVPLTGAVPACRGTSSSVLQPGLAGAPAADQEAASAVLPAPADWSGLRLALHVDPTARDLTLTGLTVTISNTTGSPIALSPCPAYSMLILNATANGGEEDESLNGDIACGNRVLPAHGAATYPLTDHRIEPDTPHGVASGTTVTVQLAIAGAPTAKTTARVG